jgi:hypothetical protein
MKLKLVAARLLERNGMNNRSPERVTFRQTCTRVMITASLQVKFQQPLRYADGVVFIHRHGRVVLLARAALLPFAFLDFLLPFFLTIGRALIDRKVFGAFLL